MTQSGPPRARPGGLLLPHTMAVAGGHQTAWATIHAGPDGDPMPYRSGPPLWCSGSPSRGVPGWNVLVLFLMVLGKEPRAGACWASALPPSHSPTPSAAGQRMDWTQTEMIRGGEGEERQDFPALVPGCLVLAGVTHRAWLPQPWSQRPGPALLPRAPLPILLSLLVTGTREMGPGRSEPPPTEQRHTLKTFLNGGQWSK